MEAGDSAMAPATAPATAVAVAPARGVLVKRLTAWSICSDSRSVIVSVTQIIIIFYVNIVIFYCKIIIYAQN